MNNTKLIVDAVIFDLDGTLIDSAEIYFKLVEEAFKRLDLAVPSRDVILEAARSAKGDLRKMLPEKIVGKKDEVINQVMVIIRNIFPKMFRDNIRLIPGAADLLRLIHGVGTRMGLVTSTHLRYLDGKTYPLRKAGVADLIESIVCIEDVSKFKPEPDPLIECAARLAVSVDRSVYVGDSYVDIRAGKAAGMKTVGVLTGMDGYERLKKEGPDMILHSVAELSEVVDFQ